MTDLRSATAMSAAPLLEPGELDGPSLLDEAWPLDRPGTVASRERVPRVLLDARVVSDQPTGLGRYATGLAQGIVDSRLPLDVTLLVHRGLDRRHPLFRLPLRAQEPTRVRMVAVPVPGVHPMQHFRLRRHLRRITHDLYHYPHYDLPLCSIRPAVVTVHDLRFLRFPEPVHGRLHRVYVREAMRHCTRRAHHIVAVSTATRDDLHEILGVPVERVSVIPEAAGTLFGPDPGSAAGAVSRAHLPRGLRPGYLLFVGERRPHKNLVRLVQAYGQMRAIHPGAPPLVVVGQRDVAHPEPEETVRRLKLDRHVCFLEGVPDATLQALYAHAAAFVLPSLHEGFGLPILEAMQAGVPVITSNRSSMPEVAGDAALLVDPQDTRGIADAMRLVLCDERLRRDLAFRGQARARAFTWKRVARATYRVYCETLMASGSRAD
ncbi:MAG: glycosyltransferase family 1 protein [Candidatus Eiseniibacteriota bacterium]|jgi:glycosyltransferase involved in cell wall biosynthesis